MILVRSLVFAVCFYLTTALFLLLGLPLLAGPRWLAMLGLDAHARTCLWLHRLIVGARIEVRGREHLPDGAVLIAAKHQSAWETFALIPQLRDPAVVLKAELGWIPIYGWFAHKFEHIFVAREKGPAALRQLLKDARAQAALGRPIVIFPEGTRQVPGAPPAYKPGVVALYEGLDLACVPVALNSGLFWPRRSIIRYPGTIVIEFLAPIPAGLDRRAFRATLQERIETATDRLIAETQHVAPDATALIETFNEH
jgi:1-acyl-sn-glycerol-3-phosphate acyltransferase